MERDKSPSDGNNDSSDGAGGQAAGGNASAWVVETVDEAHSAQATEEGQVDPDAETDPEAPTSAGQQDKTIFNETTIVLAHNPVWAEETIAAIDVTNPELVATHVNVGINEDTVISDNIIN